jgi:multicomponent K+:H+ antiporter subunit G
MAAASVDHEPALARPRCDRHPEGVEHEEVLLCAPSGGRQVVTHDQAVGLLRLPDFYTRAHAPAKAATLGLLLAAAGSIVTYGLGDAAYWLEKLLLVLFVLITVPISTQVLVRSAVTRGIQQSPSTQGAPSHFGQVPPRAP